MERRTRVLLAACLASAPCALAAPTPKALRDPLPWLEAALDPALRVPHAAALLGQGAGLLLPGERVLEATLLPAGRPLAPEDRADLYRALRASDVRAVRLHVARGSDRRLVIADAPRERALERVVRAWPLGVLAAALPSVRARDYGRKRPPLCGAALRRLVVPRRGARSASSTGCCPRLPAGSPGRGAGPHRVLGWTLLPASFLHLAMRFPVVSPRFRAPRTRRCPTRSGCCPPASASSGSTTPSSRAPLERIALGAALAAALLLCVASATAARRMKPIERARTGALIAGVGLGVRGARRARRRAGSRARGARSHAPRASGRARLGDRPLPPARPDAPLPARAPRQRDRTAGSGIRRVRRRRGPARSPVSRTPARPAAPFPSASRRPPPLSSFSSCCAGSLPDACCRGARRASSSAPPGSWPKPVLRARSWLAPPDSCTTASAGCPSRP